MAQTSYPEKPIRLLYGFPAGQDLLVRTLADRLSEEWKQPVIVENITGAAGNIAADRTAKAAPDGYTIGILGSTNIVINVNLHSKLPYAPAKDLIPVTKLYAYANLLAVSNDVPAMTVPELLALARAQPGKLSFGHAGLGTTMHLSGEMLKSMGHVDLQQVPYRGVALQDLVAGRISMMFAPVGLIHPLAQEGKVRLLAATSASRWPYTPDVPTMIELGFPAFEIMTWFGLFVPAGTPAAIVEKIHRDAVKAVGAPEMQKRPEQFKSVPAVSTRTEFAQAIESETAFWARIIKETGVPPVE
jgi:tripartite-type tricarboxylate transporter receptor subunit TctC